jgi:hypothetical protein
VGEGGALREKRERELAAWSAAQHGKVDVGGRCSLVVLEIHEPRRKLDVDLIVLEISPGPKQRTPRTLRELSGGGTRRSEVQTNTREQDHAG